MLLLLQVVGVLAGAALACALWTGRIGRDRFRRSTVALSVLVLALLVAVSLWPTAAGLLRERSRDAALSEEQIELTGGEAAGVNVDFVEWIRPQLGLGDTFHVPDEDPIAYQWITYRLLPHLATNSEEGADWLVFHGSDSSEIGEEREAFGPPREFAPGFAIRRRAR